MTFIRLVLSNKPPSRCLPFSSLSFSAFSSCLLPFPSSASASLLPLLAPPQDVGEEKAKDEEEERERDGNEELSLHSRDARADTSGERSTWEAEEVAGDEDASLSVAWAPVEASGRAEQEREDEDPG